MVSDDGLADIEKSGGALIVKETDVVWAPLLPEIVSEVVPVGDVPPTFVVIVRVDVVELLAFGVTEAGLNTHVEN